MSIDEKALSDGYQVVAPSVSYGVYRAAVRAYEAAKAAEQPDELTVRAALEKWRAKEHLVADVDFLAGYEAGLNARSTKRESGGYAKALATIWKDAQRVAIPFDTRHAPECSMASYEIAGKEIMDRCLALACRAASEIEDRTGE